MLARAEDADVLLARAGGWTCQLTQVDHFKRRLTAEAVAHGVAQCFLHVSVGRHMKVYSSADLAQVTEDQPPFKLKNSKISSGFLLAIYKCAAHSDMILGNVCKVSDNLIGG